METHLNYAFVTALGSENLRRHWENNPAYSQVPILIKPAKVRNEFAEPKRTADQMAFDKQADLKVMSIGCVPERMLFTVTHFTAESGQPVKLVFTNPDATDHNLVIVQPGAAEEVGTASNEMAKDPKNASSDFIPSEKKHLIIQATPLIGPSRKAKVFVLRFKAPEKPGIYPYICTFPGHWVVMNGEMFVVNGQVTEADLLSSKPAQTMHEWKLTDFDADVAKVQHKDVMRGFKVFVDAQCHQCHQINGHGVALGPDLSKVGEKYKGLELLRQVLEPSAVVDDQYRTWSFTKKDDEEVSGTIQKEDEKFLYVRPSLLAPDNVVRVTKGQIVSRKASQLSPMSEGLLAALSKEQILDLLGFLEAGGYQLPEAMKNQHGNKP